MHILIHRYHVTQDGHACAVAESILAEEEQDVVLCTDVEQLVDKVLTERDLDPDTSILQIGLDDGQQQLKVCL